MSALCALLQRPSQAGAAAALLLADGCSRVWWTAADAAGREALAAAAFAESDRLSYGTQVGASSGAATATAMLSREAISRLLTEVALSGPALFVRAFQARLAGHGLRYSQAHSHSIGVAISGGGATAPAASVSGDTSAQMAAFMALIRALQARAVVNCAFIRSLPDLPFTHALAALLPARVSSLSPAGFREPRRARGFSARSSRKSSRRSSSPSTRPPPRCGGRASRGRSRWPRSCSAACRAARSTGVGGSRMLLRSQAANAARCHAVGFARNFALCSDPNFRTRRPTARLAVGCAPPADGSPRYGL